MSVLWFSDIEYQKGERFNYLQHGERESDNTILCMVNGE
jgi:hypothetical protein